jgi:hypothetical protein
MSDCREHADTGIWFPGLNDCHNKAQRCLGRNNLNPPNNPRFRQKDVDNWVDTVGTTINF